MKLLIDKNLVERRFSRAVKSYDREAVVQQDIVDHLRHLMPRELPSGDILEVGCGTGLLTRELVEQYPSHSIILNDLSPMMLHTALRYTSSCSEGASNLLEGDAEDINWPDSLAMVASSSCIQWWNHQNAFFKKSREALVKGGSLLFSTFGPKQMVEARIVLEKGLHYSSLKEIRKTLQELGFYDIKLFEKETTLYFESLLKLLKHMQLTGVNATGTSPVLTKGTLQKLENRYRAAFCASQGADAPLPLTYHSIWGYCKK